MFVTQSHDSVRFYFEREKEGNANVFIKKKKKQEEAQDG